MWSAQDLYSSVRTGGDILRFCQQLNASLQQPQGHMTVVFHRARQMYSYSQKWASATRREEEVQPKFPKTYKIAVSNPDNQVCSLCPL